MTYAPKNVVVHTFSKKLKDDTEKTNIRQFCKIWKSLSNIYPLNSDCILQDSDFVDTYPIYIETRYLIDGYLEVVFRNVFRDEHFVQY